MIARLHNFMDFRGSGFLWGCSFMMSNLICLNYLESLKKRSNTGITMAHSDTYCDGKPAPGAIFH